MRFARGVPRRRPLLGRGAKAEKAKEGKKLPRPGTHVEIEFASRDRVDAHAELAEDFIRRVLNLDWAFVSDESSLWDFHQGSTWCRMLGISNYPFATLLDKGARTIQASAGSVAALVESDS